MHSPHATPRGFKPLRAEPSGFLVHHLSHSVTVSCDVGKHTTHRFVFGLPMSLRPRPDHHPSLATCCPPNASATRPPRPPFPPLLPVDHCDQPIIVGSTNARKGSLGGAERRPQPRSVGGVVRRSPKGFWDPRLRPLLGFPSGIIR